MRRGISSSHETMLTALACAMAAVLEHNGAPIDNDPDADNMIDKAFRALAEDHAEFAKEQELTHRLRMVRK